VQGPHIIYIWNLKVSTMLQLIQNLVRHAYGDDLLPVERWALRNANKASADDIIAAAVAQSFASHFEDWTITGDILDAETAYTEGRINYYGGIILCNHLKDVQITRIPFEKYNYNKPNEYYWKRLKVNEIEVSEEAERIIISAYKQILTRVQAAKKIASDAEKAMKRNEEAWNLAERLLGMKRNEFGALVPVKTVEETECSPSTESTDSIAPSVSATSIQETTSITPSMTSIGPQASRLRKTVSA
jgi:hypothetical protein